MSGLKPPTTTKVVKSSGLPRPTNPSALGHIRASSKESLLSVGSHAAEDWSVGDRCFAGGTKSGTVAFVGEVKFQPGDWAGVILDESTGKNDGSVAGVRYFQCAENRGLFCKLNRLTRHSMDKPQLPGGPKMSTEQMLNLTGPSEYQAGDTHAEQMESSSFAPLSPTMSDMTDLESTYGVTSTPSAPGNTLGLRLHEKVVVGTKSGILRYIGDFHLKEGSWGGIELDKPLGKNDGSVDGKRYFACRPMYGLFAPIGKISRAPTLPGSITATPEVKQTRSSLMRQQKGLGGSQESLSSLSSFQSSASRRVKLGVTAITGSVGSSQKAHNRSNAVASPVPLNNSLQESLREKDQHIDQLLREREMERSEMARMTMKLEAMEHKFGEVQQEKQRLGIEMQQRFDQLQGSLEAAEGERKQLLTKLDEEKRRSDDLLFRMEEEIIQRNDLESKLEEIKVLNMSASPVNESVPKSPELARMNNELEAKLTMMQKQLDMSERKANEYEGLLEQLRQRELELREKQLQSEAKYEANIRQHEQLIATNEKQTKALVEDHKDKDCEIQKLQSNVNELTIKLQDEARLCLKLDNEAKAIGLKAETAERLAHDRLEQIQKLAAEKLASEQQVLISSGSNKEQLELNEAKNKEIAALTAKLSEKDADVGRLEQKLADVSKQLESLTNEHRLEVEAKQLATSKDLEELQRKLAAAESLRTENENKIASQGAELTGLKEADAAKQADVGRLEQKLADVSKQLESLTNEHRLEVEAKQLAVSKELDELQQKLAAADSIRRENETKMATQGAELICLKETDAANQGIITQLKLELEKVRESLKADADAQLQKMMQDNEQLRKDNDALLETQKERDQLRPKCESLQKEKTELADQLVQMNVQQDELRKELLQSKGEQLEMETKFGAVSKELEDVHQKLAAADSLRTENETKIATQGAELGCLKETDDANQKTIAELKLELEKVRQSLKADADVQLQKMMQDNDQLRKDNEALLETQKERDRLRPKCESLQKDKSELADQLTRVNVQLESSTKELQKSKEMCDGVEAQLKSLQDAHSNSEQLFSESQSKIASQVLELSALKDSEIKLQEESGRLKEELDRLQKSLKADSDSRIQQMTADCEALRSENVGLQEVKAERDRLRETGESLQTNILQLTNEVVELKKQLDRIKDLETEKEAFTSSLAQVNGQLGSSKQEIISLKAELSTFNSTGDDEKKKLLAQIESLKNEVADAVALRHVREESKLKLKDLDGRLNTVSQEKLGLETEVATMKETLTSLSSAQAEHEAAKRELESLREQEFNLASDLERVKTDSQVAMQSLQTQLNEKVGELERERKKQTSTTVETDAVGKRLADLDEENRQLRRNIVNLETNLSLAKQSKQNNNEVVAGLPAFKSENETDEVSSYRQQVDFLNSVIVDLNQKLKVLQQKYEDSLMGYSNGEASKEAKKVVPPRLYCDICEEFDLHDTDDCPQQFTEDPSAHSHHHGERGTSRPFCDHCQIFGHWTESCDGTETF